MNRQYRSSKWIILTISLVFGTDIAAESRPATASELKEIHAALSLNAIPEWKHYEVMNVEGTYAATNYMDTPELRGVVWFRPYLIQSSLCLAEVFHIIGVKSSEGIEWRQPVPRYLYWEADAPNSCAISDRSQIPSDSVAGNRSLPSADMVQIIQRSDELLAAGLRYATEDIDFDAQWEKGSERPEQERARFSRFQSDTSLKLISVDLDSYPLPGHGFAYSARFAGGGTTYGPSVRFSVTPAEFRIHGAGYWQE